MTQENQKTERCYICGKYISGDEIWPLYYAVICSECVYAYCVQCEVCGEIALSGDNSLILVNEGEEAVYYHRECFEKQQLLENLVSKIKRRS